MQKTVSRPLSLDRLVPSARIAPKRVAIALSGILLVLLSLHLIVAVYNNAVDYTLPQHLTRIFNVNTENSIPTWYSSILLFVASGLLALIATAKKQVRDRYTRHWQFLALLFLLLSLDEAASLHEAFDRALHVGFDSSGLLYYAWVIPGMIFVGLVGLAYFKFLKALPAATRWLFILAGMLYVGGAIGVEILGGSHAEVYGRYTLTYSLFTAVEEALEMSGIVLFIYALLTYFQATIGTVEVRVQSALQPSLTDPQLK
jgi:hypothetical protein